MMNDNTNNSKLVNAICTQCGGQVEVNSSQEKAVCIFCGTTFMVEKAIHDNNVKHAKVEHVYSVNIKGPISSVLNFVEKQQDKQQQKIDEEKRRLEEEKRKQEEQRKQIISQIFNKKLLKRNLVILGVVLVVTFFCCIFSALINSGDSDEEPEIIVDINMPASSNDFQGENYQDVIAQLQDVGFTNVQTELIDDLVFGWFTKDGEVEKVSVNGYSTYSTDTLYSPDSKIVVSYHTFPADEEEEAAESSTSESVADAKPAESSTPELPDETKPNENIQSTEAFESIADEEIITVDNNEEFLAVLNAKDPADQIIKDFAVKNEGRMIEFDGNIAHVIINEGFPKRYDFLIFAWNYSGTSIIGPSFTFRNCSIHDLNLIGDNVPDNVEIGDNLHFVAKIINYNEIQDLFYLDPISTEVR